MSSESFKKIINKEEVDLPGLIVDFMGYAGFIMGFSLVQIPGVIHAMITFFANINFRKSGKKVYPVMLKHRMQQTPHQKEENSLDGKSFAHRNSKSIHLKRVNKWNVCKIFFFDFS